MQYGYSDEEAGTFIPKGCINAWMSDIVRRMETDNDNEDWDYQYTGQAPTDNSKLLQKKENVSNVEKALHLTESTYKAMQERGYQCHAVLARETRQWGTAFMNRLAGGRAVAFDSIQHKVLYAVDKGSAVADTVGKSFDLVPGTFCLTVGGQELQYRQDRNVTYFGGDRNERNYRFKIEYDGAADSFTWENKRTGLQLCPGQAFLHCKARRYARRRHPRCDGSEWGRLCG